MFDRRDVLTGMAVGVAALAAAGDGNQAHANWGMPGSNQPFDRRMVVNKPRAYRIMEEEKLDGIIALNPLNVFYLSNFVSYRAKMMTPNPTYAVMARDQKRPIGLTVASTDMADIVNAVRDYAELVIPYSSPVDWREIAERGDFTREPQAAPGGARLSSNEATQTSREKAQAQSERAWQGKMAPTPEWGLVRLLKEMGLSKGRIAVDDWRVAMTLQALGFTGVTCVDGDNTFRRIRVIKSEVEVGWLRLAAQANQEAAMATMKQIQRGATNADIERIFMIETAKRGALFDTLQVGNTGGLPEPELKTGQSVMLDCTSCVNYYHGDFGRTFVLGEPSAELKKRAAMMKVGWDAAFAALKPGVKFSQISAVGREAMKKSGLSELTVGVGPHSVGLQHTDHPFVPGLPYAVADDLTLEENMTLTIDFPSLSMGYGNAHLEDLVRITKTGAEPLANMDGVLVVG